MKRTRVAGLIEINGGYAFIHRKNVKPTPNTNQPYGEYYVFPGGGIEDGETIEQGIQREVFEELGIIVDVKEKLYYRQIEEEKDEYLYICKYVSGEFGSGNGPEFSEDPKYKDRGEYIPEIVPKNKIREKRILPEEFKEKLLIDFSL